MRKPSDWDTTRAAQSGEYERLSLGGHVCKIIKAQMTSDRNGHEQMELYLDIAEGTEYDGFFRRQYEARKGESSTQWPVGGIFRQYTEVYNGNGETNPYFKGMIQAIVESNSGYVWDWNERSLTGKYNGVVFGEEEYMGRDGQIKKTTRARYVCAAVSAADKEVPKLKEYKGKRQEPEQFTEDDGDQLPF